jgi:IS30 family transposase
MLTIHDRPFPAVDRSEAGHWEGDLIIGNNHSSAIGTLVERQTRMVRLVHLPCSDSDSLHAALVARIQDLPPVLQITLERGSIENTNGLLRDYFPKGVTLIDHSPEHPRMVLQDRCHADLFAALRASTGTSVLRRCLETTLPTTDQFSVAVDTLRKRG